MWTRLIEAKIWCHCSVALCGEGLRKWLWLLPSLWGFVQEEAVPWHLHQCLTLPFLPMYHWCPSSCCPSAGAQREWVCVSPFQSISGSLRRDAWESCQFFFHPNPHWFLQPEVMGTYLPGTGTMCWVVWCGAGIPHSQDIPPDFYTLHVGMGPPIPYLRPSFPPGWMWLL